MQIFRTQSRNMCDYNCGQFDSSYNNESCLECGPISAGSPYSNCGPCGSCKPFGPCCEFGLCCGYSASSSPCCEPCGSNNDSYDSSYGSCSCEQYGQCGSYGSCNSYGNSGSCYSPRGVSIWFEKLMQQKFNNYLLFQKRNGL